MGSICILLTALKKIHWCTEDELYGLIETYPGIHSGLSTEFPGLLLEEDTPCPIAAVDTKTLDSNNIVTAAATNGGPTNTTGLYYYNNDTTPIFTINPTPYD